jgi:hypothetical protein
MKYARNENDMSSIRTDGNAKKTKKGYFLSLMAIIILVILYAFAVQLASYKYEEYATLRNQIFAEKVGFVLDDVRLDVEKIVSFSQQGNSSFVTISENHSYNKSQFFSAEKNNLDKFSNISSIGINISYSLPLSLNFSNGMIYITNDSSPLNKIVKIFNSTGNNLTITAYNITIVSNQTRGSVTTPTFGSSGTYVVLRYVDPIPAKSFTSEGYLQPSSSNIWMIALPTPAKNITVTFGLIDGKENSLSIRQYDIDSMTYSVVGINMTSKNDVEGKYNIFLNISSPLGTPYALYADFLKIR